jgi:hypothetical protein
MLRIGDAMIRLDSMARACAMHDRRSRHAAGQSGGAARHRASI